MSSLKALLPELKTLEDLVQDLGPARVRVLTRVEHAGESLPVHCIGFGPDDARKPTLALIGGVHGLERVGSQVVLSYLSTLKVAMSWDQTLRDLLKHVRLYFVPVVNPVGMALHYRANGNGVDLMRNAPVTAEERGAWYELHRGQRLTKHLPWYRGRADTAMEAEARALCDFVRQEVFPSEFGLTLDVHSGFLNRDRLWFPYARTRRMFPNAPEVFALKQLLRETHSHHRYMFEPQAINYTTHGDLWDYLYDEHQYRKPGGVFLPLTLEISSASWYRKNPRQLLSRVGLFHPVKQQRLSRVLRRHKLLFDFLLRAVSSYQNWLPQSAEHRSSLLREAQLLWNLQASE